MKYRKPWHRDAIGDPKHQDRPAMPVAYSQAYIADRRQIVADPDATGGMEWLIMHGTTVDAEGYEASLPECLQVMSAALCAGAEEAWAAECECDGTP